MARQARLVFPGLVHHVVQRGHNHGAIFGDDEDRQRYLDVLRDAVRDAGVPALGYVLLPDHVHLLLLPSREDALARVMQDVGRRYVTWFNQRHGRRGTLWEGRFRAHAVEPGERVLDVLAFIEGHMTRVGLAPELLSSPWCSAAHHLGHRRDPLITDAAEFWSLGNTPFERELRWKDRLGQAIPVALLDDLARHVRGGLLFGASDYVKTKRMEAGLPAAPRPRGRPARIKNPGHP